MEKTKVSLTEVSLAEFPGILVGQTEDAAAGTGVTVVLSEDPRGMAAGLRIGGGGPAARETGILAPTATAQRIHAAVLGGGSAFGLDAAGGVMRYLEKKGIGAEVVGIRVPLVTQVDIFDLPVGRPGARPDQAMGYAACLAAEEGNYRDGCYGAGCGATVGKYAGLERAMKSGIGSCVLRHGDLLVGAIVVVNALGDVYDWKTGRKVAGACQEDGRLITGEEMLSCLRAAEEEAFRAEDQETGAFNTTIGAVFTNVSFDKAQLCKIAEMAHDGLARSVSPVHTSGDGDSIIALSVPGGQGHGRTDARTEEGGSGARDPHAVRAGVDSVGTLAAWAVSEAVLRGVFSAEPSYGLPAAGSPAR